jgi:hypothetical protein
MVENSVNRWGNWGEKKRLCEQTMERTDGGSQRDNDTVGEQGRVYFTAMRLEWNFRGPIAT